MGPRIAMFLAALPYTPLMEAIAEAAFRNGRLKEFNPHEMAELAARILRQSRDEERES